MTDVGLEREFAFDRYLTRRRRLEIAHSLNLSEARVQRWFDKRWELIIDPTVFSMTVLDGGEYQLGTVRFNLSFFE